MSEPLPAQPAQPARALSAEHNLLQPYMHTDASSFVVCAVAFVWPDDMEMLVLNLRRQLLTQRRECARRVAATVIQRKMMTNLVRRWLLARELPALPSSSTGEPAFSDILWPHCVSMCVSWPVVRAARPGSLVFGRRVMRRGEWQLVVVAAAHRGECGPWW